MSAAALHTAASSGSSSPLRYLIVTLDGAGNQPPMFGIGQQLQAAGHTVMVSGFSSQQQRVQRAGLSFALLEHADAALSAAIGEIIQTGSKPGLETFVQHCMCSMPLIRQDVPALMVQHRIDRLLIDTLLFSVIALAESDAALRARSFVIVHTAPHALFPANGSGFAGMALSPVNQMRQALQLSPLTRAMDMYSWCAATDEGSRRALVTSILQLDPMPQQLPAGMFTFIGQRDDRHGEQSDWQTAASWKADDTRPLVLVSFHTSAMLDQRSRVQRTLQALADPAPYRIVATTSTVDMIGVDVPPNALVVPFIPHQHVLPRASVVVTHAGHGTVLSALHHGLPLLCLPNAMADQPLLAQHISDLGVGLQLDGETATVTDIRAAVDKLLDNKFREAAQRLAEEVKAASSKPLPC